MDTNAYLAKVYPPPPCWALVADVYASELATPVRDFPVSDKPRAVADAFRLAIHNGGHGFERVAGEPQDFDVVLLARRRGAVPHHCGVLFERRVLHATAAGVVYQDLASLRDKWQTVEYWRRAA